MAHKKDTVRPDNLVTLRARRHEFTGDIMRHWHFGPPEKVCLLLIIRKSSTQSHSHPVVGCTQRRLLNDRRFGTSLDFKEFTYYYILYLDLREGFNFSPKGFRQNSCPNVFFLPEAFFSARGWFLMQCLPKRDFGHFRPFAGYFCPFTVSFRPTIVRIQRKTCRSFRLKKEKQPVGGNS